MNYLKRMTGRLLGLIAGGLVALPGLTRCNPCKEYPKNVREFAEPWQTLSGWLADFLGVEESKKKDWVKATGLRVALTKQPGKNV